MKKLMLIIIVLAFFTNLLQAQNSLMPNDLRIKTHIIFEKYKGIDIEYPIVHKKTELQEKSMFLEIMETTLAGKIIAYDPSDPS